MKSEELKSGFKVKNVLLISSKFSRVDNVQFNKGERNEIEINVGVTQKGDNIIIVNETLSLSNKIDSAVQYSFEVQMTGVFEKSEKCSIEDNLQFGKINGAAIIFPFIREHVANVSLKAGLGPVFIPPIDFTKARQEKK